MQRTTFRINEEVLAAAKALAARQHRSLNSVMEEALRRMVATANEIENRPQVDIITWDGDIAPGIDLSPRGIKEHLGEEDLRHFLEVTADDAR
jgi:predicted transcriptional regulator